MSRSATASPFSYVTSPEPWRPHAYQKKAVKWLVERAAGALLLDPGLGKTSVTLAALKLLRQKGLVEKTLLVAPLRVCHSVWPKESQKWEDFADVKMVVLHGPDKDELLRSEADVYVINPDGLPWLLGTEKERTASGRTKVKVDVRRFKELGFDSLVVDELSKFKDSATQRFKALKQVLPTFGRRWGLTGSPAPNGLLDLFGQMYVLDEGRSLGRYVTHYRVKYFVPSWDGFGWDLREGADREIFERVRPMALRMSADEHLDMPELVERQMDIELPPEARRVYDAMEDDLVAKVRGGVVVAANAAAASLKCRQVANGGAYLDEDVLSYVRRLKGDRRWVDLHLEKVEAVAELVGELQGEPLLVAYDFEHDLERLRARLGKNTPHIGGGVTPKRSAELEAAWNRGELPVLLGHPQSIAHGLNLQGAGRHVCWHSLTWNYELYDQFVRRVLRQGQKSKRVFVHHVVAKDTVDEDVLAALRSKARGQKALFDALRARAARRAR